MTGTQKTLGFKPDGAKLGGHRLKILELLRSGPQLNTDLNPICFRYGARIYELRKAGYDIRTETVSQGVYRFTLIEER